MANKSYRVARNCSAGERNLAGLFEKKFFKRPSQMTTIKHQEPVYKSTWHYMRSRLRNEFIRLFDKGLYDCNHDKLKHGDRVHDLDYKFWDRTVSDKANYGTLYKDEACMYGYKIIWDNGEEMQCIDASRLIKWNV